MLAGTSQFKPTRCVAAVLALATVGAGTAGAAAITLIGSESKSGSFAAVSITKDAARPHAMYYKVTAVPALRIDITPSIHCTRGSKTKRKSLPVVKTTSGTRVKVPVTLSSPSTCTLSVLAGFHDGGGTKITVKLYKG